MGYITDESTDGTAQHTVHEVETQSQKIRKAHLAAEENEKKPDARVTIEVENGDDDEGSSMGGPRGNDSEGDDDGERRGNDATDSPTGKEQEVSAEGGETGQPGEIPQGDDEPAVEEEESPIYPEPGMLSEAEMNQDPDELIGEGPETDSPLWQDEKEKDDIDEVSEHQEDRIKNDEDQSDVYSRDKTTGDGASEIVPPKDQNRDDEPIMDSRFPEGADKKPRKLSSDVRSMMADPKTTERLQIEADARKRLRR